MEETFKSRVERVFGSLSSSIGANPFPASSFWRLTDFEIDRKERNRDKADSPEIGTEPEPFGRSYAGFRIPKKHPDGVEELLPGPKEEDDLEELEDDYNYEERAIESSLGRDCTLDREEEEAGREKPEDRLYMKDVADYGIEIDSGNQLPSSFSDADRDPRANHVAATLRLKEDAEAAEKLDFLPATEGNAADSRVNPPEHEANLKSILKRKDGQTYSKTRKHVCFDPVCMEKALIDSEDIQMETEESAVTWESTAPARDFTSLVPDYIRNPSKYTYYTFHSSGDVDEQSNRQACMDFLSTMKIPNGIEDEAPAELPKSVMFIPRKKRNEALETGNGCNDLQGKEELIRQVPEGHKRPLQISIPAADDQEGDAYHMDEDGREVAGSVRMGLKQRGRHYRSKATLEEE